MYLCVFYIYIERSRYLQVNVSKEFGTAKGAQFGFSHTVTAFTASSVSTWVSDAERLVSWPSSE